MQTSVDSLNSFETLLKQYSKHLMNLWASHTWLKSHGMFRHNRQHEDIGGLEWMCVYVYRGRAAQRCRALHVLSPVKVYPAPAQCHWDGPRTFHRIYSRKWMDGCVDELEKLCFRTGCSNKRNSFSFSS